MIELISLIAKSLVKQPDAVSVTMVQKEIWRFTNFT